MELGATVCLPGGAPRCAVCPAASLCRSRMHGTAKELPVRAKKQQRRIEAYTALLLVDPDGRIALCKRPESGLLGGLWALPNAPGARGPQEALALAEAFGAKPLSLAASAEYTHVFTHVEWRITCYRIACAAPEGKSACIWADAAARAAHYALPTAFAKALERLHLEQR